MDYKKKNDKLKENYMPLDSVFKYTRVSQMKTVKKFFKFNLLNESGTQLYHFST
jgi:hypothetical protein